MRSFVVFLLLISNCVSFAGQDTNGGNGFVGEFFSIFDTLLSPEATGCYSSLANPNAFEQLQELRKELEVKTVPVALLNGESVGAINYPNEKPRRIVLSERMWSVSTLSQKKSLIVHEVLFLIGYDDQHYSYSSPVMNCFKAQELPIEVQQAYLNIFANCDERRIRALNGDNVEMLREHSLLLKASNLALQSQCLKGLGFLKKYDGFFCDSECTRNACQYTEQEKYAGTGENLHFLEGLLRNFRSEIQTKSCSWTICNHQELTAGYLLTQQACANHNR